MEYFWQLQCYFPIPLKREMTRQSIAGKTFESIVIMIRGIFSWRCGQGLALTVAPLPLARQVNTSSVNWKLAH